MKYFYLSLALLITGTFFTSCNSNPESHQRKNLRKMQGTWHLKSITEIETGVLQYASSVSHPIITIDKSQLEWKEDFYSASTTFDIDSRQEGTGEFTTTNSGTEDCPKNDEEIEVTETILYTTIHFTYSNRVAGTPSSEPVKDNLSRTLDVREIDVQKTRMSWRVIELDKVYQYSFVKE